jgi:hypothetical protein
MKTLLNPVRKLKGKIKEPRYQMVAPKVRHRSDMALLTFHVINYGKLADGARNPSKRVLS